MLNQAFLKFFATKNALPKQSILIYSEMSLLIQIPFLIRM